MLVQSITKKGMISLTKENINIYAAVVKPLVPDGRSTFHILAYKSYVSAAILASVNIYDTEPNLELHPF